MILDNQVQIIATLVLFQKQPGISCFIVDVVDVVDDGFIVEDSGSEDVDCMLETVGQVE